MTNLTPPITIDAASTEISSPNYTIGELSREFGITLRSIRFYEDQGLIQPTRLGTTRIFSRRDRGRLALICRGKRLGFSLKTIKTFLDLYDVGDQQVEQMRFLLAKAQERQKALEQQRVDLEQTLRELQGITADIKVRLSDKAAGGHNKGE